MATARPVLAAALMLLAACSLSHAAGPQLSMSWGPGTLPGWRALFVTNMGDGPISIEWIELNGRKDCQSMALDTDKNDFSELAKIDPAWITAATIIALDTPHTMFVSDIALSSAGVAHSPVTLQVGDSVAISKHPNCPTVVRATIQTNAGPITIQFDRPFTQH